MNRKSLTKSILNLLLNGAMSYLEIFDAPWGLTHPLIRAYKKSKRLQNSIYTTVYRLKKQNLVTIGQKDGKTIIEITQEGKKKILEYKLEEMQIARPEKWDGKWRIVIFDIPEKQKIAREILRQKLSFLGFYRLQKSVWVFPFDCQNQITFLKEIYEVTPYVIFILADHIDNCTKIKRYFGL